MSAPLEPQTPVLDSLLADDPVSQPSRPSVLDALRDSAGTDPTRYNQAVAEVPIGTSPRFVAESPEWYDDRELKQQARLIEERPRLRRSFEQHPDLPVAIGNNRLENVARAHDSVQSPDDAFGQIAQTFDAAGDQLASTGIQYRVAYRANLEISDIWTGSGFGGAANRSLILDDLQNIQDRQASLEGLALPGKIVAYGVGQTPHMLAGLGGRAAAAGAMSLTPAGPAGTAVGAVAGGAVPMVLLEQGLFYAQSIVDMPEVPKEDRAAMASVVGLVNGALELVPIDTFTDTVMGRFKRDAMRLLADRTFRDKTAYVLRRIGAQVVSEAPIEALQEIPGTLVPLLRQYANGEIELTGIVDGIVESELGKRMLESAAVGAMGAPVPAAIGVGLSAIGRRGQVQQAQENREAFQRIADAAVDNREIIDEMPERYHQLIEEAVDENGQIEGIYINPDALTGAYESEGAAEFAQLLERIPGLAQAIETAQDTGSKVRLSPADFATFVAPSERFQKLADDLSFNEDQASLRESVEATKPENIEKMRAALTLLRDATGTDPERDVELEKDFVQTLSTMFEETMPAVAAPVRQKNAELLGRIVMRIAEMDGSDPLEAMSTLLDRVQFEQRPELDSPAEVQRSGQVLRDGGGGEVLGQLASISMPVFPERPPSGSVLRDGEEALDLWMMGMGLSDGSDVDSRLLDAWTQLNLVEPDGQGGYTVTEGAWDQELSNWADAAVRYPSAEEFEAFEAATSQPSVLRQQVGVAAPEEVRAAATQALADNAMNLTEEELGQTALDLFRSPRFEGKRRVDEVAEEFEAAAQLKLDEYTPENVQTMGRLIATEVLRELRDNPETAIEWYAERIQNMQKVMALIHPEVADDPLAKAALNIGLAITSQGTAVPTNLDMAEQAYEHFQKHGEFPIIGTGQQTQSQKKNFELVNKLISTHGFEAVVSLFDQYGTQSQFDQITKKSGADAKASIVPGSVVLGPKIGRFYQNLNGNFEELTVDLWFMRMWGRLTGRLMKVTTDDLKVKHREELKAAAEGGVLAQIGVEDVDLAQLDFDGLSELATRVHKIDGKQEFSRDNSDAVNALYKAAKTITTEEGVIDAPESGTQRQYHREAVAAALEQLSAVGINMTPAALQATVWYPEKALYAHLGAGNARSAPTDFEAEARRLAEERGHDLDAIESVVRGDDGGRRAGAAGAGGDAGERRGSAFHLTLIEQLTGLQPVPAGSGQARAFGGRGTKTGLGQRFSPTNEGKAALGQLDVPAPTFEQVTAKKFFAAITAAKTAHEFGSSVELKSLEEYDQPGMRLFLAETVETTPNPKAKSGVSKKKRWLSGFAITPDGDIVSAFNHPEAESDRVPAMLLLAIQEGGYKLDAFDTVLPDLYSAMGFVPTARVAFDEDQAPPDWDRELYSRFNDGRPDIVFMRLDPLNAHDYVTGEGPMLEYGQAVQSNSTPVARAGMPAGVDRLEQAEAAQVDETQAAVDAFNRGDIDLFRQAAFHGTGSRFDRFSTDFMGTGEGVQAFGWGLYFSSSRKIAEYYRKSLSEGRGITPRRVKGVPSEADSRFPIRQLIGNEITRRQVVTHETTDEQISGFVDAAISAIIAESEDIIARAEERGQESQGIKKEREFVQAMKSLDRESITIERPPKGQVFKVDIPDDSELMDWDGKFDFDAMNRRQKSGLEGLWEFILDQREYSPALESALEGEEKLADFRVSDFYKLLANATGSARAASEKLNRIGIKGHKYKAGQLSGGATDATNYVIYDDAAIQIAETFYSQSQEATPSTRGQLIVDRRIQKFLLQLSEEKVNDSTLTHEIFHLALELVLDASERPGAGPEITAFREQIFGFLGVDSRDQIGRDQHERWAESGEVYMASGEAPTAELRNLFRFFFQRFKQVYRAIRDQLRNADPNSDFVPIFDRLLASEDEIRREANRDNVVAPMLAPELTELMTDAEEEELRRNLESVNAAERAKLERTIAQEDERILKAQMGELKRQVREEVYGRRVHKLALWLRTGRTEAGEPIDETIGLRAEGEHKMNGELLDEVSGDVSTRKSLRGMWKEEGGLSPDAVAVAAGYNSADEMLVELLEMEPSKPLISRIIHERAEQQGLVSTPEQLREAASEKVDGQARDRLYAAQRRIARRLRGQMPAIDRVERKRLQGQAAPTVAEAQERLRAAKALLDEAIEQGADPGRIEGIQADIVAAEAGVTAAREARADQAQARREARASRSKMPVRAIRAAAREMVNDIEFGQLKREVQRFKKMRAKASMAQTEAALARDWDALEQAIDQEQLANALAEEGAQRLEDVRKYKRLVESFDKPGSRKRARLSKHGDYEADNGTVTNVMDVIDGLLSMVSFKNMSLRKIERAANVEAFALLLENDAGIALPLPEWVGSVLDRPNYKKMKVGDLEDLYVAIKAIEKFGMDLVSEREDAAAAAEQEEVDAMLESLDQQKPVAWAGKGKLGENQRSKAAKFFGGVIGAQMSFESIADILDDLNPEGAFNRFFVQRFKAAAREEERLRKMVSERVNAAWNKYSEREKREFYSKPIKILSLGESLSKNEILAIAANMGNPHNRKALEKSARYPLSEGILEEILSHVTDKDADYLQAVIDSIDLLWEPAAAAEREINGVVPPKVEAVPWTLPSGRVMKGGYFPLMFDPELDVRSADHHARAIGDGLMPQGGGSSMTKVGAMKARKSSGKLTVRTDFHAILQKHVNSMAKDIAWRGTIVRADRQLRKIAPELKRVLGEPFFKEMRSFLKRQATPIREGDQGPPEFIIKAARRARSGLGLSVMAWRLTQAAIQWSGFVTAIPRVGASNIAWGWADVTSTIWNWDRITHYRELIPELRDRAETFDRDAQQEMLRLKPIDPARPFSSLDTVQAFSANVGYTLLGMIDTVTSTAVAAGAMRQAMSGQVEGILANDLDAAVRYAGKIIDRTQGSGGSVNAPRMLDGGEMMKLLTPMMSFVNAQTQQAVVYAALGRRQMGDKLAPRSVIPGVPRDAARFLSFWLWAYLMESLLSEGTRYLINGLLGPDEPDEEAFFNTVLTRTVMGPLGGVPLIREVETIGKGFKPDTPLSTLAVTAYNATLKPALDIAEGDYDGEKHIRALATGVTYATGLPSKQALDAMEVLTQESFGRGR